MLEHETRIWVSYSDIDQMGFVHHSNYAKYYENARWNAFRHIGLPYSKIEQAGVLMPVIEMEIKFLKPAYYDDELLIKTTIVDLPKASMQFYYNMFNSKNEPINQAKVRTAFVNKSNNVPRKPPQELLLKLETYFTSKAPKSGDEVLLF